MPDEARFVMHACANWVCCRAVMHGSAPQLARNRTRSCPKRTPCSTSDHAQQRFSLWVSDMDQHTPHQRLQRQHQAIVHRVCLSAKRLRRAKLTALHAVRIL
jgi:hypothetical protein